MDMDDARWNGLEGGYRMLYDPRPAVARLVNGDRSAWEELWEDLHHQGDLGVASYAAIPLLVENVDAIGVSDWNLYGIAAVIEEERQNGRNPEIPLWLVNDYRTAWDRLCSFAADAFRDAESPELISSILAVLAHAKKQLNLARFAMQFTEEERQEVLDRAGW